MHGQEKLFLAIPTHRIDPRAESLLTDDENKITPFIATATAERPFTTVISRWI